MSLVAPPTPVLTRYERLPAQVAPQRKWIPASYNLLVLAVLLVGALYLRLHLLAHKSLWFDEGFSVEVARLDWLNLLHLLWVREANMGLYYLLLKLWLSLGISEFHVRALSVVFGVAAIPIIYALGSRLFGHRAGLIAAWLLAINAFHVRYSQEARGYTLVVFLCLLASWLFVRAIDEPSAHTWRLYTLASILVVYAHFYGLLLVVAQWLSLILLPRANRPRRQLFRHWRFFAYGMSPIALFAWRVGAQPMHWLPRPDGAIMRHFFQSLAGNGGFALLGMYLLAWIAAGYARWRSGQLPFGRLQQWRFEFLFLCLVFPIAIVYAVSQFESIFLARYLIVCLPASVLLAAAGIARLRPVAQAGMLLLIGILSIGGVHAYYQHDFDVSRDDWRTATQYLLANSQPGDGIFFYTAPGRMTFEYYRLLAGKSPTDPQVIYPASGETMSYRDFLVNPLGEVLQNPMPQPRRVWLFLNNHRIRGPMDMGSEAVCAWYGKRYQLVGRHTVDGLDLLLYSRDR
jgi:mannosyltransferase